ncbi:hypothetical protein DERP_015160 [Dermatophagoides pteronyssinus]|uniref:Uncharacterized protein n=1 Tax=Dermatophagoides pteronyssinus TaxID=6956 RepID=A0ABQ8JU32_DERPT|nr:hypothetical protein DERP_015160 [Dermatophagoides pteronyssinus]
MLINNNRFEEFELNRKIKLKKYGKNDHKVVDRTSFWSFENTIQKIADDDHIMEYLNGKKAKTTISK